MNLRPWNIFAGMNGPLNAVLLSEQFCFKLWYIVFALSVFRSQSRQGWKLEAVLNERKLSLMRSLLLGRLQHIAEWRLFMTVMRTEAFWTAITSECHPSVITNEKRSLWLYRSLHFELTSDISFFCEELISVLTGVNKMSCPVAKFVFMYSRYCCLFLVFSCPLFYARSVFCFAFTSYFSCLFQFHRVAFHK